jgi:hypothetical protein
MAMLKATVSRFAPVCTGRRPNDRLFGLRPIMPVPFPVFSAIQSSKTMVETSSTELQSESTKQPRCHVTTSSESNHVLRYHFYYQLYSIEPKNQRRVSR